MKRRIGRRAALAALGIALLFGAACIRAVNRKYPSPEERCFHTEEKCTVSDYRVSLLEMELLDGEELSAISSGRPLLYDIQGAPYPWEKQKLVLAEIEIEGTGAKNGPFDLTKLVLEAGAWSNGMEMELFQVLNGGQGSLYVELAEGEKQTLACPFLLNDRQFEEKGWERLDSESFSLILSYYPEKKMLLK